MSRAIVLIACLFAAAGVAAYTHFAESEERPPVYTVMAPPRPAEPAVQPKPASPAQPPQRATATPGDRASLARELQRELKRVGCYGGEVNGVWTTSSRMAMKSFTDHVNASLPIETPDYVLLSLVQGHQDKACSAQQVLAKAQPEPTTEPKAEPPAEKSTLTTGSVVPATAAAAAAFAATAAVPKGEPKANLSEDRLRPAAVPTPSNDAPPRTGRPERSVRHSGPMPSERVYERRPRRHSNDSRPPKFVRNLLRTFGLN